MFRNVIQMYGGILPKQGYGHNHKYSLNHKQQVYGYVHTAQDGDLKI